MASLQYCSIALITESDHSRATSFSPYFLVKKVNINYYEVSKGSFLVRARWLNFRFYPINSSISLHSC